MRKLLVFSSVIASLALAGATQPARAPTALLTYSAMPSAGLCVARPDGSRRVRLLAGEARTPSWSPDGRLVAFQRGGQIVVANARGRIVRRFGTEASEPAWSPTGNRIAYAEGPGGRIVIASREGRTLGSVSLGRNVASSPTWSPDGRRLAYAELLEIDSSRQAGANRIHVVNADGTGRRLLVGSAAEPAWSPDGSRIAYIAYPSRNADTGHVAVIGVDGAGARTITSGDAGERSPAWSPRGRLIAFVRGTSIATIRPDGTGERVVVAKSAADPAWRPAVALPKARRKACA